MYLSILFSSMHSNFLSYLVYISLSFYHNCTTSDLVCTSCTRGVQNNGAICLVVLQSTEILGLIISFTLHFLLLSNEITPKPNWPVIGFTTSDVVCTSCTRRVQENAAIGLVVLQSTEILFSNTFPMCD